MTHIIGEKQVIVCSKCTNYGYYEIGISESVKKANMFCACPIGQGLKRISVEWRLNDIKVLVDNILPRIVKAKDILATPTEAGKILDELIQEIDELVKRSEKALRDVDK